jgi:hypothetical protein
MLMVGDKKKFPQMFRSTLALDRNFGAQICLYTLINMLVANLNPIDLDRAKIEDKELQLLVKFHFEAQNSWGIDLDGGKKIKIEVSHACASCTLAAPSTSMESHVTLEDGLVSPSPRMWSPPRLGATPIKVPKGIFIPSFLPKMYPPQPVYIMHQRPADSDRLPPPGWHQA